MIKKTYASENLPSPLSFDKLRMVSRSNPLPKRGNSSLLQREGRRDLVFNVHIIMG